MGINVLGTDCMQSISGMGTISMLNCSRFVAESGVPVTCPEQIRCYVLLSKTLENAHMFILHEQIVLLLVWMQATRKMRHNLRIGFVEMR